MYGLFWVKCVLLIDVYLGVWVDLHVVLETTLNYQEYLAVQTALNLINADTKGMIALIIL